MAYYGSVTVNIGDYTKASDHDKLRQSIEYLRTAADVDHDFDTTTASGYHRASVGVPLHLRVDASTVWSCGWWQSSDGRWWWLYKAGEVASFTRAEADFYVATGDIDDVPSS